MNMLRLTAAFLLLAAWYTAALAHSQSYGYLNITPGPSSVSGHLALAVRDLDTLHDLDADGNGQITWGEFRAAESAIAEASLKAIAIGNDKGNCRLGAGPAMIDSRGGETYAVLPFTGECPPLADTLAISYRLMFQVDAQHRGLVAVNTPQGTRSLVMTPGAGDASVALTDSGAWEQFTTYAVHGIQHIWKGYDHILFLITLLFGTVTQAASARLRQALGESVKVVTAFTLSHSLTLGLAATGLLRIPVSLAESLIALTIVVAALNNIRPFLTRRIWLVALFFGLIHGVGFANVLADLGLPSDNLLVALLAFNIGVEAGQLAIVAVVLPVLMYLARQRRAAPGSGGLSTPRMGSQYAVMAANAVIAAFGVMWFSDRVFGTALMPF